MTRIFGVPRLKIDFQKRNSLTGRLFFQMFPNLYAFLLDRLRTKSEDITRNDADLHPSLFPILVLMGRLHPPACDNVDSAFHLDKFIPLIRACGSSPVLKTRKLSAQALTPLLTPTAFVNVLGDLLDSIAKSTSHNQLHGALIQVIKYCHQFKSYFKTSEFDLDSPFRQ